MIRGGFRTLRRVSVPTACFGAGYACYGLQSRQETAPQLMAYGVAASWIGACCTLRRFEQSLPEAMADTKAFLARGHARELFVLFEGAAYCGGRDLSTALLQRAILRRLCHLIESNPQSEALTALVPEGGNRTNHLAAVLGEQAETLDAAAEKGHEGPLLPSLANALGAFVLDSGASVGDGLDAYGALQLARAAVLATDWLGEDLRPDEQRLALGRPAKMRRAPSREEDLQAAEEELAALEAQLAAVWDGLARSKLLQRPGRSASQETQDLYAELNERVQLLGSTGPAPVQPSSVVDLVPVALCRKIARTLKVKIVASAGPSEPRHRAARVPVETSDRHEAEPAPPARKVHPVLSFVGGVLELAAWGAIIAGTVWAAQHMR